MSTPSSPTPDNQPSFSRAVAPCHHHHHHHHPPQERARLLIFEGGCSLSTPSPTPDNQPSFSRAVALCQHHHHHPPRKRAHLLVFKGGCSLPSPPSPSTLKRARLLLFEGSRSLSTPSPPTLDNQPSFSRAVTVCHHHHHHHHHPLRNEDVVSCHDHQQCLASKTSIRSCFKWYFNFVSMYIILR
jgi:hypothetical protein